MVVDNYIRGFHVRSTGIEEDRRSKKSLLAHTNKLRGLGISTPSLWYINVPHMTNTITPDFYK
jgi:hypothetical protein